MKKLTENQLDRVRAHLDGLWAKSPNVIHVRAEFVAKNLDLPLHIVKQAFHRLNLEGRLSTPRNNHIFNRHTAATLYFKRDPSTSS